MFEQISMSHYYNYTYSQAMESQHSSWNGCT